VRGIVCRGLRLELVAGLGIAFAIPALAMAAGSARLATQTTMTVDTHDQGGRTRANVTVFVRGEDGQPGVGAVAISDGSRQLAGAHLNAQGETRFALDLSRGDHSLSAAYTGDTNHRKSTSTQADVQGQASSTPDFQVSAAPATLSLTAGQSGLVVASVTPENAALLQAPMFVTLSCSGLPDQAACVFTPENIEILPGTTAAVTSSMLIETQKAVATLQAHPQANPVSWALLLPGVFGLGGLAWGARRRRWLNRFVLLALVAFVSVLGTTACSPLYSYYNHGPGSNPVTPAGSYSVNVTAQSSNGITAITHSTTLALTVK